MEQGLGAERAAKRVSGRASHLWTARNRPATLPYKTTRRSAYGRGVDALFPWSLAAYPGKIAATLALLNGRAATVTIKHWLQGRRRAPQWACELLSLAIDRRIAELQHAKAILAKKEAGN